jgi:hypothetical protein
MRRAVARPISEEPPSSSREWGWPRAFFMVGSP